MLARINTIVMMFHACMVSLAGMDPVGLDFIYDENNRSGAVICIDQEDDEARADSWQAHFYDALIKKDSKSVCDLLSVYNQACKSPDLTRFSDEDGCTFLMLAVELKSLKIIQIILRLVDPKLVKNYVNRMNRKGLTALDYAVSHQCMRILCALSEYANEKVRYAAGRSLLLFNRQSKGYAHINRHKLPLCLSKISEQDPSDDEDKSPLTQTSPSSSTSSDVSMIGDDLSLDSMLHID